LWRGDAANQLRAFASDSSYSRAAALGTTASSERQRLGALVGKLAHGSKTPPAPLAPHVFNEKAFCAGSTGQVSYAFYSNPCRTQATLHRFT